MLPSLSHPPLPSAGMSDPDGLLAARHLPLLMLDSCEPAPPLAFGYTVFSQSAPSPSSKFHIVPPAGGNVIEYAVWHDWDIEHLYDLEHVWVHLDAAGAMVRVETSMHGMRVSIDAGNGLPELNGARPVLYVEPGKHALWSVARAMRFLAGAMIEQKCGPDAGSEGVHMGNPFAESGAYRATGRDHRLARLAMRRAAFKPSFEFTRKSDDNPPALVPWHQLAAWIPLRVQALIAALPAKVPHIRAVFLDCGDTLIDEGTEIKQAGSEVVTSAEPIPGAVETVERLEHSGYRLALVADGPRATFENLLKPLGLWQKFETHTISEDVGELKPSPKMFAATFEALGIAVRDANDVVMVGNNLSRDIKGANAFGLKSVFFAWSDRRSHEPAEPLETPHYKITSLGELLPLLEAIETGYLRDAGDAMRSGAYA